MLVQLNQHCFAVKVVQVRPSTLPESDHKWEVLNNFINILNSNVKRARVQVPH